MFIKGKEDNKTIFAVKEDNKTICAVKEDVRKSGHSSKM